MAALWHNGLMENMDNMYRMREAHKRMKASEEAVHPVTDEEMELGEHDRTLSQIMQDKKEQDRFINRFCFEKDPDMTKGVVESLAAGTLLTPEQDKFLEKVHGEYNLRRAEIEQVREMLTPEEMQRIADLDPRIQQVMGKIGPEKTVELLGKEFEDLAMSDSAAFKKVVKNLRLTADLRSNEKMGEFDRHVQDTLRRYGIKEEKYWEATTSGRTSETQANLDALVAEQYGWFKKAIDFASGGKLSRRAGTKLYRNFEDQTVALETGDKYLKAVGKVLQGTLTSDVRLAIQKAMMEGGEVKEKKAENNIQTIADYKTVKQDMDMLQPRWEQFQKDEIKRLGIKDISRQPDALDGMKDRFSDQEMQKQRQYRASGALGALLAFLFGTRSRDDIKNSLK